MLAFFINLLLRTHFKPLKIKRFSERRTIHEKYYMEWDPTNRPMLFKFGPLDFYVKLIS